MSQKINIIQVAKQVASITGCSQVTAETFLKEFFSLLTEQLQEGVKVKIKGLGTFKKEDNNISIISFEPDKHLALAVNLPFSSFEPVELDDDVTDDVFNQEIGVLNHVKCQSNKSTKDLEDEVDEVVKLDDEIIVEETVQDAPSHLGEKEPVRPQSIITEEKELEDYNIAHTQTKLNHEESQVDSSMNNSNEELKQPNNINKAGISITVYVCSMLMSIAFGFGVGYLVKSLINENDLIEKIDNQQKQLDSIQANLNSSIDSTKNVEPKDTTKYDTVKVNRYITTMAQDYYGNINFWSYIYEENKEILGHPDKIYPGMVVKIPPASKYEIDATDPISVQKAQIKAIEIYKNFKK